MNSNFLDLKRAWRYFRTGQRRTPFNLKAYREGFEDHRGGAPDDGALIGRLLEAYHAAKRGQAGAPPEYQLGGEWIRIIEHEYRNFLAALKNRDARALAGMLTNFCRNECSRGLAMSSHLRAGRFRPLTRFWYLETFRKCHDDWVKSGIGPFVAGDFAFPNAGNPVGLRMEGVLIPRVSIRHRYYAKRILEKLAGDARTVVEIGGGFGGLAAFLLREAPRPLLYFNFDLPEMNVINGYFLAKAFPEKRIWFYGEGTLPGEREAAQAGIEIVIAPNFLFPQLADLGADLVFNSSSLSEMDASAVAEYYRQIGRVSRLYFMHVNHDDEDVYDARSGKKHVRLSKMELPGGFRLVYQKPSFYKPSHHEYLYERQFSPQKAHFR